MSEQPDLRVAGTPVVLEPAPRARVRRPADGFWLGLSIVFLVAAVAVGDVAVGTATGLEQDLIGAGGQRRIGCCCC